MNRLFRSFIDAWRGIRLAVASQQNLKIHLAIATMVILAGIYFQIRITEWLAIVLAIGLVISAEMMNTALENIVNLVSPAHQPLAGKIKDLTAGAVLVLAITAVIIGVIIFIPYLYHYF